METNSLSFLYEASNNDLKILVDIITRDKAGNTRLTEVLTITDTYKNNYPNNIKKMLPSVIDELENFGGNTFANFFRQGGQSYGHILRKVAKKLKVSFHSHNSDETIECYIVQKLFDNISRTLTDEQIIDMMDEMKIKYSTYNRQIAIAALQFAIRKGGFQSYIWLVTIANVIAKVVLGRGLTLAANAALTRWTAVIIGPIGWAITAIWTAIDIAGPAYRITIPAVIHIAYMRQKIQLGEFAFTRSEY